MRVAHLNQLHRRFQEKGLVVVGVANEYPPRMERFIEERGVEFPVVLDSRAFRDYDVRSVPDAVLVGPDGKVLFRGHPDRLTDAEIEKSVAGLAAGRAKR